MIADELRFHADMVATQEDGDTPECVVYGLYFGEGDPAHGGQHWNFTRSLDDDDGVCIVKEVQEVTVYGGIVGGQLTHDSLVCTFDDDTAASTRTRRLVITFDIDDNVWNRMVQQAKFVFDGVSDFIVEADYCIVPCGSGRYLL